MNNLTIRVHGIPAPQGSKEGFYNKHVGRVQMVESSSKVKPWRQDVKHAALEVLPSTLYPLHGPVRITIQFLLPRPKGHFRTGKNAHLLRDAAPAWPATKPDVDKLLRSTLDALGEAGVWRDDSQVVDVRTWKSYTPSNETPGAVITVESMAVVS